ncbi:MAG: GNAT family N-acetyltransferase, partial [Alicyclobacillus sp.]|nr:GNAT family N-acetyltransferase [Alicyclobacillus sp.]
MSSGLRSDSRERDNVQRKWTIRTATNTDCAAVAKVHVDSWRTTYRGIVPDHFLDGMSYTTSEARWKKRFERSSTKYAMFVAEDESGKIIGFADGGPERSGDPQYDGELYAIYLLQDYQRQGVGRELLVRVAQHLARGGFRAMLVRVLAENPFRRFYESMGGTPVREQEIEIGGKRLK